MQPPEFSTLSALLGASESHEHAVHAHISDLLRDWGFKYLPGPLKAAERILNKASRDYSGVLTRVCDTVRGSVELDSIGEYIRVVKLLTEVDPSRLRIRRTKDRVSIPMETG